MGSNSLNVLVTLQVNLLAYARPEKILLARVLLDY
jgi:hypothetical protein